MQRQLEESMARLRALIAEAHALNDTLERVARERRQHAPGTFQFTRQPA
jgi:hypothetical protein